MDDGSTDNTREVVKTFLSDERISYSYKPNEGVCAARNFGVKRARGRFILFFDADDTLSVDTLTHFIKVIHGNSNLGICSAAFFEKRLARVVYPTR